MIDHDKVDLMTQIDSLRRGWAACEETVSRGAAIQDALRASLHDLEKRHEEAELALEVARRDRDAAIARAAGLRKALELLLWSCVHDDGELTVPSRCVVHEATAALDPPGPSIGEIKAEALESLAEGNDEAISQMTSPRASAKVLRAEADRLRAGGGA